jgi:hypothetical protein
MGDRVSHLLVDRRATAHHLTSVLANRPKRVHLEGVATREYDGWPWDNSDAVLVIDHHFECVFYL